MNMDAETGELLADTETGEMNYILTRNSETGEEEHCSNYPIYKKRNFKIPSSYFTSENSKHPKKEIPTCKGFGKEFYGAFVFLLPTMIFFYPILGVWLALMETTLHIWAHKKNKKMKNQNLCYKSPLHMISSEFCGPCKEERSKLRITKIQDIRNDKLKKFEFYKACCYISN